MEIRAVYEAQRNQSSSSSKRVFNGYAIRDDDDFEVDQITSNSDACFLIT